ncbi:hypothetical protein QFZ50_003301 [Arthrobacter agilis]|nr:hypothetical protein [Arthrobacter agilis]
MREGLLGILTRVTLDALGHIHEWMPIMVLLNVVRGQYEA